MSRIFISIFSILFFVLRDPVLSSSLEEVRVDLSNSQTTRLVCPISESQFAQWFRVEKRTGQETEIFFGESRYDFPDLNSMTVKKISAKDDGVVYKCKVISDELASDITYEVKRTFKLVVKGRCSHHPSDFSYIDFSLLTSDR